MCSSLLKKYFYCYNQSFSKRLDKNSGDLFVLQVYELHNGGEVPVHYEVDIVALSQLQVDNFNHPVLCCLNPEGEVLPGKTARLEWIFSPLEAKMYYVRVEPYPAALLPLSPQTIYTTALGSFYCRHHVSLHCSVLS